MRRWLRLWPGMQDEVLVLTDDEVIEALASDDAEARMIRLAEVGEWLCDADGYYVRLQAGPLIGHYLVPR